MPIYNPICEWSDGKRYRRYGVYGKETNEEVWEMD